MGVMLISSRVHSAWKNKFLTVKNRGSKRVFLSYKVMGISLSSGSIHCGLKIHFLTSLIEGLKEHLYHIIFMLFWLSSRCVHSAWKNNFLNLPNRGIETALTSHVRGVRWNNASEKSWQLCSVYSQRVITDQHVWSWYAKFHSGETSFGSWTRTGPGSSDIDDETEVIREN